MYAACILLGLMASSCGSKNFNTKEDMLAYLNDINNGYHFQKSVNGFDYSLMYKPTDLLVLQFVEAEYPSQEIEKLRKKYAGYLYFNLDIGANGMELLNQNIYNRAEFGAMVNQLSFGMADKINLIGQQRDTIPLLDYVSPRMYGMGQGTEMLLVYERNPQILQQEYLLLIIKDLGFGTGEVTFKIETNKIINQPKLIF